MAGTCSGCGADCVVGRDYQRVYGWEKRRYQGGTNQIKLREPQDEWLCVWCLSKLERRINLNQGSLV